MQWYGLQPQQLKNRTAKMMNEHFSISGRDCARHKRGIRYRSHIGRKIRMRRRQRVIPGHTRVWTAADVVERSSDRRRSPAPPAYGADAFPTTSELNSVQCRRRGGARRSLQVGRPVGLHLFCRRVSRHNVGLSFTLTFSH